jgi:methionyl-tRNA formyltransferase
MRIVFMGTPDFAVSSLRALVEAGFDVVGVITAPDKPAGRGLKLSESAVKQYALTRGLTILQPEKLKNPEFLQKLKQLNADIQVVVAFRMLPEIVWDMPPHGTINLHGSLLPKYRGAAPINWAVINGEKETGVTTFKLQHEIDTGSILLQSSFPIGPDETAGEIHDRMKEIGAAVLVETIRKIGAGEVTPQPQPVVADAPHAPKIFTETCRINWEKPLDQVYNLVRGLSPYPGAFTIFDNKTCKILRASKEFSVHQLVPGTYQTDGKTFLNFVASDGYLNVMELQLEGKKKMNVSEFLRGFRPKT